MMYQFLLVVYVPEQLAKYDVAVQVPESPIPEHEACPEQVLKS